jgi:hypothetical protein
MRIRKHWRKFGVGMILLVAVAIGYWAGYRSTVAYNTNELPVARGILWTEVIPVDVESSAHWECAQIPNERAIVTLLTYSVPYDRRFVVTKFNQGGTVSTWVRTLRASQASEHVRLTASEMISLTSIVASLPKFRSGAIATEAGSKAKAITWAVYMSEQGCILKPCWESECWPQIEALQKLADQAFRRECHGTSCVHQVR